MNHNRYFQDVLLTREAKLQANVSVTWTNDKKGQPEMVAVMTDQIACRARLREYSGRMSIEQSFRDDKSGGFDMQHTRLQHAQRIDHLLLAVAIATLWCHELGEFVLKQGEDSRCQVDPAHKRTLSLFQLGLRWLKRTLATGFVIKRLCQAAVLGQHHLLRARQSGRLSRHDSGRFFAIGHGSAANGADRGQNNSQNREQNAIGPRSWIIAVHLFHLRTERTALL